MKFIIKMTLEGAFPGSPDHDTFIVDNDTWDKVRDIVFPKFLSENQVIGVSDK